MLLNAYSIYDRKSLAYHTPYFTSTDGAAARSFSDLVNDPNTNVGRHPNDYVLYCVGQFDDAKGVMIPLTPMRHVIDANALVALGNNNMPLFGPSVDSPLKAPNGKEIA